MKIETIGIVGYGKFGQFLETLAQRFLPEATVHVYSRRFSPDWEKFYDLKTVASSDVVILTGAISEFQQQLESILPLLAAESIIVDVSTIKTYTTELLRKHAKDKSWIAIHPMFGPESYLKKNSDVTGFRVVVSEHTLASSQYEALRVFLSELGFNVVVMDADEHDKLLAESLFLTHYVAQVISEAGIKRSLIDTVSFSYLMDAVESVVQDTELFTDVYTYNPYCKPLLERFAKAEEVVNKKILQ